MRKALIPVMALLVLLLPSGAFAAKHHGCKPGYVKRSRRLKRHRHHKTVRVRVTVCIKRPVKHQQQALVPKAPSTSPAPGKTVKLHAHLDPSFTRDPSDPFKVTYAYSASATSELIAASPAIEPATLPEGVLTLYNDGILACSINVGGETTGGQCPVEYKTLGEHKVTTIYQSGATNATETSVEKVEAFVGAVTLSSQYVPFERSIAKGEAGGECYWIYEPKWARYECRATYRKYLVGELEVSGSATTSYGEAPGHVTVSGVAGLDGSAPRKVPVCAVASEAEPTTPIKLIFGECPTSQQEGSSGIEGAGNPWGSALTASAIESGSIAANGADTEAGPGYELSSAHVPIQFKPEIKP